MLRHLPARLPAFAALWACALGASTVVAQTAPAASPAADDGAKKSDEVVTMDKFIATDDVGLGAASSSSVLGFDKSAVETPRSLTVIPDSQLSQQNILKSEDLAKAAPATYTNFRFGLQGTVSIRNQSSDFYFDGMRRVDPQGDFESVWGAYDSLEIVEGPSLPIFGMGRIGGYVNFTPKSARAQGSEYITADTTSVSVTYGSFNTLIAKIDYEAPLKVLGHQGGISVFIEDKSADSYYANGFSRQKLLQFGYSVNLNDDLRLQAGFAVQLSYGGLPGGDNRSTVDTIPNQIYWSGNFKAVPGTLSGYNLDENGDGWLDEKENRDSYFRGTPQNVVQVPLAPTTTAPTGYSNISAASSGTVSLVNGAPSTTAPGLFRPSLWFDAGSNDSFFRTIPWQGGPIPQSQGTWTQDGGVTQHTGNITMAQLMQGYLDTAQTLVGGAPVQRIGFQMMFYPTTSDNFANYIPSGPNATKSGQVPYTAGGVKYAFWLPPAFDINPTSWQPEKWNKKMAIGEDYYQATIGAYYLDVIHDTNPNFTYKDQIFVDGNNQTKSGSNSYSQTQHPQTFEDKFTSTKKLQPTSWWNLQVLGSVNYYHVWESHVQNSGDSDLDMRRDLQFSGPNDSSINDTFTSNDRWYSMTQSSSYTNGLPVGYSMQSSYAVTGVGLIFDNTIFKNFDLMIGGRWDYVSAYGYIPAGVMDIGSTSSLSATYLNSAQTTAGSPLTYIGGTGSYIPFSQEARGNSNGPSWTVNLSYSGPFNSHPYITVGNQTILLNQTGSLDWGSLQNIKNSLIGLNTLFETGIKGYIGKQVNYKFDYYNQYRAAFEPLTSTAGGASNSVSRGEEATLAYQVTPKWNITVNGNWSVYHYEQGGSATEPAEAFGFPNVVDPATGKVLIPSDAFAWGGRIQTTIPDSSPYFRRAPGIPAAIITANTDYELGGGYFVGGTFFFQSAQSIDRLDTIWIPKAHTFDGVVGYHGKKWDFLVNVTNIFGNNIYNYAGFAAWIDPKFQRAVNVTVTHHF